MIKNFNLLIIFLIELAMLGNFAVWGFALEAPTAVRYIIGLGVPSIAVALWSMFFSPKATIALGQPWNAIGKYALFSLSALAVASAGYTGWSIAFSVVAITSETITLIRK